MSTEPAKHIITISTNVSRGCQYCQEWQEHWDFERSVNHYLQAHQCVLLHVGAETSRDDNGKPWHATVAVLGSETVPPPPEPINVVFVPMKAPQQG